MAAASGALAAGLEETVAVAGAAPDRAPTAGERAPLRGVLRERYAIARRLDAGGQGVVYEAWDRKEARRVALKVCSGLSVSDHHRLKREYRAIKQLHHPNIARVHELIEDRERGLACFSMELIQGVDFLAHVRRSAAPGECRADLGRLRAALRQLASGLQALHAAGHTHRDVKPSNVLVAEDGRVVLLDFGLVSRARRGDQATLCSDEILGTPYYMAPEQLTQDGPQGAAIDCYALGVMIYEALTGRMPLEFGSIRALLAAKCRVRPRPPSSLCAGVPEALEALVLGLLERDPAARRGVADVLAWCGDAGEAAPAPTVTPPEAGPSPGSLAARRDPLRRLARALARLRRREPRLVVVKGPAGSGKSALVRHFLAAVREHVPQALILEGRCDDHESVPYRAFDRIVDELARFLIACPEGQRARHLAGGTESLAVIFPILTRVPGIAPGPASAAAAPGARERAFAELRALLGRIAGERALILAIANLHRSDRDSLLLLGALAAATDPLPMLVLATIRGDAGEPTAIELGELPAPAEVIEVAMLSPEETVPYARERLRAAGADDEGLARALAHACRGDTRLLARLAPHVARRPPALAADQALDLGDLLAPIVGDASPRARGLLELLALAGGPIALDLLERASGAIGRVRPALLELRERGLVDVDEPEGGPAGGVVRCVSEAVAAAIAAAITDGRRALLHRDLARAHQASAHGDEERCVDHLLAAGDTELARDHAAHAALLAQRALAFEQAVRLYGLAVACDPDAADLRRRHADALAAAGDFERAADERLRAARGARGRRALEMATTACDHLFLAGRCARGRELAAAVLRELAIDAPALDAEAERLLARELACLRAHPLEFRPQARSQIGGDLLLRVDAPLTLGRHLRDADPTRAAVLLVRAAQTALLAGEPGRIARALALAAGVVVGRDRALAGRLLARAAAIAGDAGDDHGLGVVALARGLTRLHEGDAMAALADLAEAQEILGARGLVGPWERRMLVLGRLAAHDALGEVSTLAAMIKASAADPMMMNDAMLRRWAAIYEGVVLVARGDVEGAELRICAALRALEGHDPRLVLALTVRLAVLCDLARGVPRRARSRITSPAGAAPRGPEAGEDPRLGCHHWAVLEGRVALACAALRTGDHERCCATVLRAIDSLAALGDAPAIAGEAALLRAGLAHLRGDRSRALCLLCDADRHFLAAGMSTAQAVVQLRIGELTGGEAGQELRERARRRLRDQGIREPDRFAAALAPGFDHPARPPGAPP